MGAVPTCDLCQSTVYVDSEQLCDHCHCCEDSCCQCPKHSDSFRLTSQFTGTSVEMRLSTILERDCIHCGHTNFITSDQNELVYCAGCGKPNPVKH